MKAPGNVTTPTRAGTGTGYLADFEDLHRRPRATLSLTVGQRLESLAGRAVAPFWLLRDDAIIRRIEANELRARLHKARGQE